MFEDFSELVSAIYETVLTPQHWDLAVTDIGKAFGGAQTALLLNDGISRVIAHASFPAELKTAYDQYYSHRDDITAAAERGTVGLVRPRSELIWSLPPSEIHHDWCIPNGFVDGLFVRLTESPSIITFVVVTPGVPRATKAAMQRDLLQRLTPHLQRALRTRQHLVDLDGRTNDLVHATNHLQHGIVLLAPNFRLIYANAAAEHLLAEHQGMRSLFERIDADYLSDDNPSAGGSLLWPRPSNGRPLIVHVMLLPRSSAEQPRRTVMVVIVDPDVQPQTPTTILRHLYGLTRSEAEVAVMVARGHGLKPIAEELTLSIATVKSHLQRVFDKTHTHRQAELARLLFAHTLYQSTTNGRPVTDGSSREPSVPTA